MQSLLCSYPDPSYLLFSENVPPIVYYSHFPIIAIAILLGFFVFFQNKKNLPNVLLFLMLAFFGGWVFLDSIFWAANRSDIIMFVWSLQILIEPLVHLTALYLVYVLINKKDIGFWQKIIMVVIYLPIVFTSWSKYVLSGFDLATCLSQETFFSYYTYLIEIIFSAWLVIFSFIKYKKAEDFSKKREILLLATGTILFLLTFSWGAITGSFTENWSLAQWGLIGMPIFAVFLTYLIIRYQTFNVKLFSAQALVAALVILTGAQLAFIRNQTGIILGVVTFVLVVIVGFFLIRGVRSEIRQKEYLEKLSNQLEDANEKLKDLDASKNEFLSFATHQLRSPLTSLKWGLDVIVDTLKEYRAKPDEIKTADHLRTTANDMVRTVEDLLNISKIEQGGFVMNPEDFDVVEFMDQLAEEFRITAQKKELSLTFHADEPIVIINGDRTKLRQVVVNIIDNSIKYTQTGSIRVTLHRENNDCVIMVTDTGPGIAPEELVKLFNKFGRGDAGRSSQGGSGLGLYLAKKIMELHHGNVEARSEGIGKGSSFIIKLPIQG